MTAWAQDPRGTIQGRVTDSSGAVTPGVTVKITNIATNLSVSSVTNEAGDYRVPYLLPGLYRVEAEATGFKRHVRDRIELRVGDQLALDLKLELGEVVESVVVTGETPLLESNTASMGQSIDQRRLMEMPVASGNVLNLARFVTGAVNLANPSHPTSANAADVVSRVSINGTGSNNSEFLMDGIPNMQGQVNAYVPPADMVQEIKIETVNYDARSGRSPGGLINMSVRSGSNEFHGTLSNFHSNAVLKGQTLFQRRQAAGNPPETINRFGGTIGGPVILPKLYHGRNRTFFAYAYEGLINNSPSNGTYRTVPTAGQRNGNFSDLLSVGARYQIYDPATIAPAAAGRFSRQPFPGNIIPASRIDPVARNILPYWPDPNTAGTADGTNNYFRRNTNNTSYDSHLGRVDHNFSSAHRLFVRFHKFDADILFSQLPNFASSLTRGRGSSGLALDDVYVFNPEFIMNFRYGATRYYWREKPDSLGMDLAGLGFDRGLVSRLDPQGIYFPSIQVSGLQALGVYSPFADLTNYHTGSLDFTKIHAAHTIRFGGEFRLFRESHSTWADHTPRMSFDSTWTNGPLDNAAPSPLGQGLASFLLGIPSSGQLVVNPSSAEQSTYSAAYIQDDWKVNSRLTVNLGFRYEYETPATERYNRSVRGFDFTAANPIEAQVRANYALSPIPEIPVGQFRAPGGLTFAGVGGQPRTLWRQDKNNFGPRIGLAYRLFSATVVRAGYGVYYVPLGVDRAAVNQSGYTQRTEIVPSFDNGLTFNASLRNPLPGGFQQPLGAAGGLSTDLGRSVSFFEERARNGYMQRWSFGVQHQLPKRILAEASYVANRGVKLPANVQLNPIPAQYLSTQPVRDQAAINRLTSQVTNPFFPLLPGTGLSGRTVARSQLLRPHPQFTGVSVSQPVGFSWYHSLQTRAERRFASGFTVNGTYTWAKFMDATTFLNEVDLRPERVISGEDRPHRFTVNGVWELPFGPGRRFASGARGPLRYVVAGWQFQGTYEGQSGGPLSWGNIIFNGNLHDIPLAASQRTLERWFNTAAGFERDSRFQLASNIRRFPSRLTGVEQHGVNLWNLSGTKNFHIRENVRLQLRSEWINATNHTHLAAPNTNPISTAFGTVTSNSGQPRIIFFALKLLF